MIQRKIAQARNKVRSMDRKKKGFNKYSEYAYFTPEQINEIVAEVCDEFQLFPKFDLLRNELGEIGELTIYDLETQGDKMVFTMATAIPEIKATNLAQQLGGCMTYTERYLKQTAFGIAENADDFDARDNRKPSTGQNKKQTTNVKPSSDGAHEFKFGYGDDLAWITEDGVETIVKMIADKQIDLALKEGLKFKGKKIYRERINEILKNPDILKNEKTVTKNVTKSEKKKEATEDLKKKFEEAGPDFVEPPEITPENKLPF